MVCRDRKLIISGVVVMQSGVPVQFDFLWTVPVGKYICLDLLMLLVLQQLSSTKREKDGEDKKRNPILKYIGKPRSTSQSSKHTHTHIILHCSVSCVHPDLSLKYFVCFFGNFDHSYDFIYLLFLFVSSPYVFPSSVPCPVIPFRRYMSLPLSFPSFPLSCLGLVVFFFPYLLYLMY